MMKHSRLDCSRQYNYHNYFFSWNWYFDVSSTRSKTALMGSWLLRSGTMIFRDDQDTKIPVFWRTSSHTLDWRSISIAVVTVITSWSTIKLAITRSGSTSSKRSRSSWSRRVSMRICMIITSSLNSRWILRILLMLVMNPREVLHDAWSILRHFECKNKIIKS